MINTILIPIQGNFSETDLSGITIRNSNGRFSLNYSVLDSLRDGDIYSASFKVTSILIGTYTLGIDNGLYISATATSADSEITIVQKLLENLSSQPSLSAWFDSFSIDENDPTILNFVNKLNLTINFQMSFPTTDNQFIFENDLEGELIELDNSYNIISNDFINSSQEIESFKCLKYFNRTYFTILSNDIPNRYSQNRNLSLLKYLPSNYLETDVASFLKFFEDFLNNMFDGVDGYSNEGFSGFTNGYNLGSSQNERYMIEDELTTTKFSILEKIFRLSETHDPDLIDIDFIQYFAKNLGYSLNVYRDDVGSELGNFGTTENILNQGDINKYLRFMVSNLPMWYKIKTTESAVQVMLYSFGLVGDLIKYYTDMNSNQKWSWYLDYSKQLQDVPQNSYSTPHFALKIDIDSSVDIVSDITRRAAVIRAIDSIRPINCVFKQLSGYIERNLGFYVKGIIRYRRYMRIGNYIEKIKNDTIGVILQNNLTGEVNQIV